MIDDAFTLAAQATVICSIATRKHFASRLRLPSAASWALQHVAFTCPSYNSHMTHAACSFIPLCALIDPCRVSCGHLPSLSAVLQCSSNS
jgi:hypothetical protein